MTAERITQGLFLDQVYLPAKYALQLFNHVYPIEQAPPRTSVEAHHHINVAIRPEIVSESGTEQGELGDFSAAAEICYFLMGNLYLAMYRHETSYTIQATLPAARGNGAH